MEIFQILYVDLYYKNKKIAIEYDGEQHFKFNKYFHRSEESFVLYKNRDKYKNKLLKKHNIKLVRFSYNEKLTDEYIINKINNVK